MTEQQYQDAYEYVKSQSNSLKGFEKANDEQWKIAAYLMAAPILLGLAVILKPLARLLALLAVISFFMTFISMIKSLSLRDKQLTTTDSLRRFQDRDLLHNLLDTRYQGCITKDGEAANRLKQSKMSGTKIEDLHDYGTHHLTLPNGINVEIGSLRMTESYLINTDTVKTGHRYEESFNGLLIQFKNALASPVPLLFVYSYARARIDQYSQSYMQNGSNQIGEYIYQGAKLLVKGTIPYKTGDKSFDKTYSVFSKDKASVMLLDSMKRSDLIRLEKEFSAYFNISYVNQDIYIYIHDSFDYLRNDSNGIKLEDNIFRRYINIIMNIDKIYHIVRL